MHPLSRAATLGAVAALAAILVPSASAAQPRLLPPTQFSVTAGETAGRSCAVRSMTGAAVVRRHVTSPVDGVVSVRTNGPASSDWDVGLVDRADGRVLNGAAGPDANEVVAAIVSKGQRLAVQACRLEGARRLGVRVQFTETGKPAPAGDVKLVRVDVRTQFDRFRLGSLGLDTTDHPAPTHQDVLLHSAADERKLQQAGFTFQVRQRDVIAHDRANRLREQRRAARAPGARAAQSVPTALPSGRSSYRTLPEIEAELRTLAQAHPNVVRLFELPLRSFEGRPILGIEIAENVNRAPDGRPVYIQVGTHHAREWPANEATFEFGIELIKNFTRDPTYNRPFDPRLDRIVREARTYVIPVLNVDGFDATIESEGLNPDGSLEDPVDTGGDSGDQSNGSGAYKRKSCTDPDPALAAIPCLARTSSFASPAPDDPADLIDRGVDPNRNYGVEWGGPGTFDDREQLTAAGPSPFSESEVEGFRRFVRDLQPTVLITNHTYTGLILRPPGTSDFGPVPDEDRLRALGDAMGAQTTYISQFSYQLYDTTGTTDDYLYDGLGSFSYTPEIGKVEFHPEFTTGFVPEYDGRFAEDPNGNPDPTRKLGGLREAFTLAGLTALDSDSHSLIRGTAPAGRTLVIEKSISYRTSARPNDEGVQHPVQTITEPRRSSMVVGADGRFTWHVNPSSQPRGGQTTAWRLTCRDGAGNVLEERPQVFVARDQILDLALTCGAGGTPTQPAPVAGCPQPNGFRSVNVRRNRRGLRIRFSRVARNPVTVEIFQASKGRRIVNMRRIKRWRNRTSSFVWNGRVARRLVSNGVYVVRFRIRDAGGRLDTRRVVIERRNGRFAKRGSFYLADTC